MKRRTRYEKRPYVAISQNEKDCARGWEEILSILHAQPHAQRIAVECYPGAFLEPLKIRLVSGLAPKLFLESANSMLPTGQIEAKFAETLGDDPVFGYMRPHGLEEFFDSEKLTRERKLAHAAEGRVVALGTGATLLLPEWDLLLYVDVTRWELQQRQRRGEISNLGLENAGAPAGEMYKRSFFIDWRVADRKRNEVFRQVDFWIDGNLPDEPKMLSGERLRDGLIETARRPFRVVPFFDPGPWGGQWMRRQFDLPDGPANYAWCFDCVPEENSLLLGFGAREFELPALILVHQRSEDLLGPRIVERFGAEFPIRFDFLDTIEGGNLSLQVHPLRSYIEEKFGLAYTQDESYYLLDAEADATVYLGLREDIDREQMAADLKAAEAGGSSFAAERYVNIWPARKHDHFLIPAGTIHCSGRNSLVLEISATPYIFTFKLWDWSRLGLDGRPRPIHLEHGLRNIQWNRTTVWVREHLINKVETIARGDCWREERTGLHSLEFIETRRHWFTGIVPHDTKNNLHVLNLVEGDEAVVESPSGLFPALTVHYAETFIVPAAAGRYTVRPAHKSDRELATIKAYVRGAEA